jgi:hypothetical protein
LDPSIKFRKYNLPIYVIPGDAAVIIDSSAVIHQLITRHSISTMQSDDTAAFYRDFVAELRRWKSAPAGCEEATLTLVADGLRVPAKLANAHRADSRSEHTELQDMLGAMVGECE